MVQDEILYQPPTYLASAVLPVDRFNDAPVNPGSRLGFSMLEAPYWSQVVA